jgi:NhaA family Na+:H+ antiporter
MDEDLALDDELSHTMRAAMRMAEATADARLIPSPARRAGAGRVRIIGEPAVARRVELREALRSITSNGTVAAALMVLATVAAIVVANSPAHSAVEALLAEPVGIQLGLTIVGLSVESLVNDLLMAVFFLLVGVELKYEMTVGQLRVPRQAALPIMAAVGGVAGPCVIYALLNIGGALHGWAVPMATDIAFALGVMSLLGDAVSPATKVFFSTLAIADDILAIVVLALFYGQAPDVAWLLAATACCAALALLNHARVYKARAYLAVGVVLWVCMLNSGVHATLAGVILAFFLPGESDIRLSSLCEWLGERANELDGAYDKGMHVLGQHDFTDSAARVERVMHKVTPPLQRVERVISVPVNFVVLPLFAFVNAQVCLAGVDPAAILADHVTLGVFLGALLGKPAGIIAMTLALVRMGFARLPKGVGWSQVIGVGLMGGMGFTMSILIAGLAFDDPSEVLAAKCAILAASVAAALVGSAFILLAGRRGSRSGGGSRTQKMRRP